MISPNLIVWAVGMYNIVTKLTDVCRNNASRVRRAISTITEPREYIFFHTNPAPYLRTNVNADASGSIKPMWIYNADTRVFYKYDGDDYIIKPVPLPVLSLEILYENKVVYDLTEFLETVRVAAYDANSPSVQHLLGAWSLSSGIVLDINRGFIIRFLCTEANMYRTGIDEVNSIHHIIEKGIGAEEGVIEEEDITPIEQEVPSVEEDAPLEEASVEEEGAMDDTPDAPAAASS